MKDGFIYCQKGVYYGKYILLTGLNARGTAVVYSSCNNVLALIRNNGSYADIYAGAAEDSALDDLGQQLATISWQ